VFRATRRHRRFFLAGANHDAECERPQARRASCAGNQFNAVSGVAAIDSIAAARSFSFRANSAVVPGSRQRIVVARLMIAPAAHGPAPGLKSADA